MKNFLYLLFLISISMQLNASHLVGGNISYEYLGNNNYRFTVTQYRDCRPPNIGGGNPQALSSDYPLFISIFSGNGTLYSLDSVQPNSPSGIIVSNGSPNIPCLSTAPNQCVNKIQFVFIKNLSPNFLGYYITSQRCCWAMVTQNITDPASFGQNLFLFIPPNLINNSAVFKKDVGDFLCINKMQTIDFSATDADGDSLSYSMSLLSKGASQADSKPLLTALPPTQPILYAVNYTYQDPLGLGANFNLDATSGIMTVKPNLQGLFLMGVVCTEWRNGIAIQESERNEVVRVVACNTGLQVMASPDVVTQFNAPVQVSATGAPNYHWTIEPSSQSMIYFNNDTLANPTVLFNTNSTVQTGVFTLIVEGSSLTDTCTGRDSVELGVLDGARFFVPNAFSPNNDGRNDYLKIFCIGYEFEQLRVFNKYGNKVFESNSPDILWDGTYKNTAAASGTYIWTAKVREQSGRLKNFSGSVTIIH